MLVARPIAHSPFVFCPWQDLTQGPAPAKAHTARNQTVQILCGSAGRGTTCSTYQRKSGSLPLRLSVHLRSIRAILGKAMRMPEVRRVSPATELPDLS